MLFENEKKLLKIIKYAPTIFVLCITIFILAISFFDNKKKFELDKEKIRLEFTQKNEENIKQRVYEVYDFIKREQEHTERELKDTLKEAIEVRDNLEKMGWPYTRKYTMKYPKYICRNGNKFQIHKMLDGKIESFGTFSNIDDAIKERDLLINADWDYENLLNEI